MIAGTIVSLNYLPQARVVAQTFLDLHLGARFVILVIDAPGRRDLEVGRAEVVHPVELGLKGHEPEVLARFGVCPEDVDRFRAAFPDEQPAVTLPHMVKAIASFERVLLSGRSAFDRYLYEDDRAAMSDRALLA